MPSQSREKLEVRIAEVECLLFICRSRVARGARNRDVEARALLRSSLVMLCSHIEGFFEELVSDVVGHLDVRVTRPSQLPMALRVQQVIKTASGWMVEDLERRWSIVRECTASPLLHDHIVHRPGFMDTGLHTEGFANPGTNEIRRLFKTVGIADVWSAFHAVEPSGAYKAEVDAIVARRNQIAHGDMGAAVLQSDLDQYIHNFRRTADVFDAVAQAHISEFVPAFVWP